MNPVHAAINKATNTLMRIVSGHEATIVASFGEDALDHENCIEIFGCEVKAIRGLLPSQFMGVFEVPEDDLEDWTFYLCKGPRSGQFIFRCSEVEGDQVIGEKRFCQIVTQLLKASISVLANAEWNTPDTKTYIEWFGRVANAPGGVSVPPVDKSVEPADGEEDHVMEIRIDGELVPFTQRGDIPKGTWC